jgi:hypothetical protein
MVTGNVVIVLAGTSSHSANVADAASVPEVATRVSPLRLAASELAVRYSEKKSRDRQPIVIGRTATRPVDVVPALMTIPQDEPNEVGPL